MSVAQEAGGQERDIHRIVRGVTAAIWWNLPLAVAIPLHRAVCANIFTMESSQDLFVQWVRGSEAAYQLSVQLAWNRWVFLVLALAVNAAWLRLPREPEWRGVRGLLLFGLYAGVAGYWWLCRDLLQLPG